MATKSLLLSCLLMGMSIAQHPVSGGTQTQDAPTFTVPAGVETSTDPPLLPIEWNCVPFMPEDIARDNELSARVDNIPSEFFFHCLAIPSPEEPECEPVHVYRAFLRERCPGYPANVLSNILGIAQHSVSEGTQTQDIPTSTSPTTFATSTPPPLPPADWGCELPDDDVAKYEEILSNWREMPIQDAENCSPGGFPDLHVPDHPECEPVQELMDFLKEICSELASDVLSNILKDVNDDNDRSCLSRSAVDWSESPRRHNEADICVSRPAQGVSLGKQDSDEPYDPDLKPVYDFCDVLEDPEEHTMCVLAELERALCEQEPWIAFCQNSESGRVDWFSSKSVTIENDLLDEIFDTDDVIPVADDDGLPHHPQVSAAFEATGIARLIEEIPLSSLEKTSRKCEHAVGYLSVGHCVSEKMRDKVCSSNPRFEMCEVPRAALINERDLPLYTKTNHLPLYTETTDINN